MWERICRGSVALKTGCGFCVKCCHESEHMRRIKTPPSYVDSERLRGLIARIESGELRFISMHECPMRDSTGREYVQVRIEVEKYK